MGDEPEVIREQMEITRSALTDKIERLEQAVTEKVQTTTAAVTDTVESVKDAVQDTMRTVTGTVHDTVDTVRDRVNDSVESVKEAFDLPGYFQKYPWASFSAAVGVGIAGGIMLKRNSRGGADRIADLHSQGRPYTAAPSSVNGGTRERAPDASSAAPTLVDGVASKFGGELEKLKGVALGFVFGLVRDWVGRSTPDALRTQLGDVIDDVTRKLGGEPIRGNLLDSFTGNGGKIRERETCSEARARERATVGN